MPCYEFFRIYMSLIGNQAIFSPQSATVCFVQLDFAPRKWSNNELKSLEDDYPNHDATTP